MKSGKPITEQEERPLCKMCGTNPCRKNGVSKKGFMKWKSECSICHKIKYVLERQKYRRFKTTTCAHCDFVPEDPCQMDVDHIDGNHENNSPENLQTLCANCHRLKTKRCQDWLQKPSTSAYENQPA